jgi:hypothetical protein
MPRTSLNEISRRAALIKSDPKLRHKPNKKDLQIAFEHAKLAECLQCQNIL